MKINKTIANKILKNVSLAADSAKAELDVVLKETCEGYNNHQDKIPGWKFWVNRAHISPETIMAGGKSENIIKVLAEKGMLGIESSLFFVKFTFDGIDPAKSMLERMTEIRYDDDEIDLDDPILVTEAEFWADRYDEDGVLNPESNFKEYMLKSALAMIMMAAAAAASKGDR